jgi:hypothetical protein
MIKHSGISKVLNFVKNTDLLPTSKALNKAIFLLLGLVLIPFYQSFLKG